MTSEETPRTARVVVMFAMEEEAQFFYPSLENKRDLPALPGVVRRVRGEMGNVTVDCILSGIMAVHAAMATTATLTDAPADAVLSVGCSGAHLPEQGCGDLVIGKQIVPLSAEVVERTSGKSRLCGVRCSMLDPAVMAFDADELLVRIGTDAAQAVRDEIASETEHAPRIDVGTVGSSDVWRQDPSVIAQAHELSGSVCEEMEAHAVAQVCRAFNTPFLAIKDIANSEIHPEPIQLEPSHALVPDSCSVGVNACRVAARAIRLMASDADFLARPAAKAPKRGREEEPAASSAMKLTKQA